RGVRLRTAPTVQLLRSLRSTSHSILFRTSERERERERDLSSVYRWSFTMRSVATGKLADFCHACSRRRVLGLFSSSSSSSGTVDPKKSYGGGGGENEVPHLPVLIVGAGPVGLILSILLTKLGARIFFSPVRFEFTIYSNQMPVSLYGLWLAKMFFGFVIYPTDFDKIVSPISVAHFSQYKLMNLLLQRLEKLGFSVCSPSETEGSIWDRKILMGHECISIHPTNEGLKVGTSYLKEGKMEEREFHCSILVGSDGAKSTVRKLVDIDMKGERNLQTLVSVHFLSKDLGQYLLHERPGMLFFIFNPDAIGVLVAHDLDQGEFVLQVEQLMLNIPYYSPQQKIEDFSFKIAIYNTSLSVENFRAAMSVPAALGLDPAIANSGKNITAPCNLIWQLCS
ncbi:hypothetical protein BHM03_00049149, partial [Ensete ventricosum]